MRTLYASTMALLIIVTTLVVLYNPASHEQLAESPTGRKIEKIEYNGFNTIYTQVIEKQSQQDEQERKAKRKQALKEAHRLYNAKIAEEKRRKEIEQQRIEAERLAEKRRLEAQKQEKQVQISRSKDNVNVTQLTMIATHYTAYCEGCSGITATGIDVKDTIYANGLRIIAVDPRLIPLGSIVRVEYADGTAFKAISGDVGGAIKNNRIDVLVVSENEAYRLGKQTVKVTILKNGKGR